MGRKEAKGLPEMTPRNESCTTIFLRNRAARDKQAYSRLSILVPLVIPLFDLGMDVVPNVVVAMQGLRFPSWPNSHRCAGVNVRFRHGLFPLFAPPEPRPRCEKRVADTFVKWIHYLRQCIRGAKANQTRRALRLLCNTISLFAYGKHMQSKTPDM